MAEQREAVCVWCGATFVAPSLRGPLPKFCRRSHRQRAYEAKRLATTANSSPPESVTGHGDTPSVLDLAGLEQLLEAEVGSKPTARRAAIEAQVNEIRAVLSQLGVDDLTDSDNINRLINLGLVAELAQRAAATAADHPRSAQQLGAALSQLSVAGSALINPSIGAVRERRSTAPLPVAVPGPPNNRVLHGTIACELNPSNHREVHWYTDTDAVDDQLLSHLVGRATPYRFATINHWTELATDIVTVTCGWLRSPLPPPPVLTLGTQQLGRHLYHNYRSGEWAITSTTITHWLQTNGYIHLV